MESSPREKPERHAARRLSDHLTFESQKQSVRRSTMSGLNARLDQADGRYAGCYRLLSVTLRAQPSDSPVSIHPIVRISFAF
jgi:hypothetical protein